MSTSATPQPQTPQNTHVLHLDEYYPGAGTLGKVPIVVILEIIGLYPAGHICSTQRVYDSNRTNEENDSLTLQTWAYATIFAFSTAACLAYKFLAPTKSFQEQEPI